MANKQVSEISKEIGKRVTEWRELRGYSQLQLASGAGLTRTSVVNIEAGRQSLTVDNLLLFCSILNCKYSDLLPPIPKAVIKHVSNVKKVVSEKLLSVKFKL